MNRLDQPGTLSPGQRIADIERLHNEIFDVIVVGGGVTGAGAALDAAARGLSVALIEADDFASGTSSKSSKLIHGGLRYLEMLDFGLVREALTERRLLLQTIAPHMVEPIRFVWPLNHPVWERAYLTAGLTLYDTMAGKGAVPRHRQHSKKGLRKLAPGFGPDSHRGGLSFYDAGEDDARMVMMIVRTAREHGAAVISGARVSSSAPLPDSQRSVQVRLDSGEMITARARHVAYATGPFSDQQGLDGITVRPSKGVHIMIPKDRICSEVGVLMRTEKSVLFIIPWLDRWLIGDTDTDWPLDRSTPVASGADIDYLLAKANTMITPPLTREDIVGVFSGLRPLVQSDPNAATTKLSREHSVVIPEPGVSMIAGGKYTTYRVMAEDLIDAVIAEAGITASASPTRSLPLLGGANFEAARARRGELTRHTGLAPEVIDHLLRRHGSEIDTLIASTRNAPELLTVVEGYEPYIWAELSYAFSHEGARSLHDALERRTRIKIQFRDSGLTIASRVAELGAKVLGWDADEMNAQVADYELTVCAERAALETNSDDDALAAYRAVRAQ
jgi:glycerol-3-phosphate dehydrogenase